MSLRGGFFDRREKNPVARYEAKQSVALTRDCFVTFGSLRSPNVPRNEVLYDRISLNLCLNVPCNRFALLVRQAREMMIVRVADQKAHIRLAETQAFDLLLVQFPANILHCADAPFLGLLFIEHCFVFVLANHEIDAMLGQSHQRIERRPDFFLLGYFDQERGRKLVVRWQEPAIGIDLMLDLLRVNHPLDAHHFLNLEEHGVAVLEDERHDRPDMHAPVFLRLDHARAIFGALFFVLGDIENVLDGDHCLNYDLCDFCDWLDDYCLNYDLCDYFDWLEDFCGV